MSSIEHGGNRAASLSLEALSELLSELAEAETLEMACELLVQRFSARANSSGAVLWMLDPSQGELQAVHTSGVMPSWRSTSLPVADAAHPLIVCALGSDPVVCDDSECVAGVPFQSWVALPLSQPQHRGGIALHQDSAERLRGGTARSIVRRGGNSRRRVGRAAFAVLLMEGIPDDESIEELLGAALLAGPVLARSRTLQALRDTTRGLDAQRRLLDAVLNALADPLVLVTAANEPRPTNQRALSLLELWDGASRDARRAVEMNQAVISSFLARRAKGGDHDYAARELGLVDPDSGEEILCEVIVHALPQEMSDSGTHIAMLRDVTELRRAADELERQLQRLRDAERVTSAERDRLDLVLDGVGDPIVVTDAGGALALMNPAAEALLRPASARHAESAMRARSNTARLAALITDFATSNDRERRRHLTLTRVSDGSELPVEVLTGKVIDDRGVLLAVVSVLHDRTQEMERERLTEELRRLNVSLENRIRDATASLEAQNVRLQWQSSELEKAYRLKSEFLASMSHELRTPLNALLGYASLMLDRIYGDITPRQQEALKRIDASSQHLLALINDILDLSRIEAGRMPMHLEPVELRLVVKEVAEQIEPLSRARDLNVVFDVAGDIPEMLTDRTRVTQVVLNLMSNAVKFTPDGEVRLSAGREGERVRIEVRDTGIGIKPEHVAVIFEEFRQVDQSRTREYGGTGLGLSITRRLVRMLGGEIAVESEYGRGSSFTVWLPIRSEPRGEDAPA